MASDPNPSSESAAAAPALDTTMDGGSNGTDSAPRAAQPTTGETGSPAPAEGGAKGQERGNDKKQQQQGKKNKQGGRNEWRRQMNDKRKQLGDARQAKRRKLDENGNTIDADNETEEAVVVDPRKANPFSTTEIAAEERRPKRKVAVMVGYSGTGYYGLQINWDEKTIEGDLFKAFIAAGAISKANADDPKKSSLSRCARTDKGVHAAGNLISLKLIIEDDDIVDKINAHLPDQIRVWGLQRTSNSFSAYQACDSRWYEYLLPTYCLLPSHPDSFLWKKLVESAQEKGYYNDFQSQLADVDGFWAEVEEKAIKPILEQLDPQVRAEVLERIHASDDHPESALKKSAPNDAMQVDPPATAVAGEATSGEDTSTTATTGKTKNLGPVDFALRDMKNAYVKAKRAYQVTPERLDQLQAALDQYVGTYNFHNYTIQKSFKDPSAKRHIKSFQVNKTPIQIRDTQWVSIKVHGQSFMMHQIRKMISMATLVVRCATPLTRIKESYGEDRIAIPKAPGLGLLLERPVFEGYSRKAVDSLGREPIDFTKHDDKIQAFKDKQIYQRIFEVEEKENIFHTFFQQVDNFKSDYFLWLTAGGIQAGAIRASKPFGKDDKASNVALVDDEDEDPEGGEG
ncbi:tRNA pseudouridine synthase 1 [Verticillium nonalfalfae]|uniref:tRNA pseudouridine synthase 1 n=1 Tax=Verticillium nonalfalfae TaxID=1051616 RepID=A0A3M9YCF0_9PEZI|nr:tRNA pseudouridine synthase 1 [Verticillium nonalfalfae]RNJ57881.1 tRNA pseudouridine synthase 1 [Verticillium nonalfalfae]